MFNLKQLSMILHLGYSDIKERHYKNKGPIEVALKDYDYEAEQISDEEVIVNGRSYRIRDPNRVKFELADPIRGEIVIIEIIGLKSSGYTAKGILHGSGHIYDAYLGLPNDFRDNPNVEFSRTLDGNIKATLRKMPTDRISNELQNELDRVHEGLKGFWPTR